MGIQERMERRWLGRTAPARAAAAATQARELAYRAGQGLNGGFAADVADKTRAVMAAHADEGAASDLYLTAWLYLGFALAQLGKHAAAAREFAGLVDAAGAAPGREALALRGRLSRAAQLAMLGRFDQADAECDLADEHYGQLPSAAVAVVMRLSAANTRAFVLSGRGRHGEAESAARSALRETPADLAPQLVTILTVNLARALGGQQRYEEAEMALGELRPDDAREIILVTCGRAAARLGLGKLREAEAGARDAVAAGQRILSPVHYTTLHAGTLLGAALARQGKREQAESVLRSNIAAWTEHFGASHPKTIAAREELAQLDG